VTLTEIRDKVADRLNLTSTQALARIVDSINERYRWLASDVSLQTIERQTISANSTIGSRSMVFSAEKLLSVFNPSTTPPFILGLVSFDELRNETVGTDPPQKYAIQLMGASTVTIFLESQAATVYSLNADALVNLITLSGTMVPAFAQDYHDILVYGAMATELDKMEKYDLSDKKEAQFEKRLGQFKLYQASSSYMDYIQGKDTVQGVPRSVPLV
jgi:hypothetical protein